MSLKIRRVVTGHDASGKAVVAIDEISKNTISRRPNHESCVVWTTGAFPPTTAATRRRPAQGRHVDPPAPLFRLVESGRRHAAQPPHRVVDYAIVLSGAIDMEMDGTMVQ